ncbi:glycosyltransferase family 4 protein [Roseivivax sp.]
MIINTNQHEKPRILLCSYPSDLSGVPIYVQKISNQLCKDYEIKILTKELGPAFQTNRLADEIKVVTENNLSKGFSLNSLLTAKRIIQKNCDEFQPEILHLNGAMFSIAGRLIRPRHRPKLLVTHHGPSFGIDIGLMQSAFLLPLEFILRFYSPAHHIIISKKDKSHLSKSLLLKEKDMSYIINFGGAADPVTLNDAESEKKDGIHLLSVAGFRPQKNHTLLFKIFNILPDHYFLTLVGPKTEGKEIKTLAKKLLHHHKLGKVTFVGESSNVNKYYQKSDIFILTSNYEGMPLSAIEAQFHGLPVIMRYTGGADEICMPESGVSIRSKRPQLYANAIEKIIEQKKVGRYTRKEISNNAKNKFSEEVFIKKMHETYKKVLSE